ncbi:hypothetical protein V2J09_000082 [Rumex salicifolius]
MVSDAKVDRVKSCNGVVLCSTWSCNGLEYCEDSIGMDNLLCKTGNLENGDCIRDGDREDDFQSQATWEVQEKNEKKWWFRKLRNLSCVMEEKQMHIEGSDSLLGKKRPQRVKVWQCRKKHKEMYSLYLSQDFQAHEGPILVMKFSPDGEFLASARGDRIVQLELQPFYAKKERTSKVKRWSRTSDSACVVLPPKFFRLLEKPVCEFKGHRDEILDLSWSNSNCLLSSFVDKTVRLWQIGYDHCLQVFPHNNYVTCVQLNPIDDNYFISGSLDGKVWIWEISNCHVTLRTLSPLLAIALMDSLPSAIFLTYPFMIIHGCLVGSITGFCRFYTTSDNQLLLDGQICLRSKKKSSGKRIIGFQVFIGC